MSNIYITEIHQDGLNWYKKYSNGWVEQGGYFENLYNVAIPLLVPMKNTNYAVFTSKTYATLSGSSAAINIYNKTTTSFTVNGRGQGGSGYSQAMTGHWQVLGFSADTK